MNEAFEAGITSNLSRKNRHFITMKGPAEGIYLNKEELKAIEELDLSGNRSLGKVRDLFLIGCYTGLRYSDYSTLTTHKIKDGFIRGTQKKTGDPVTILLHDAVIRILRKYPNGLPISFSNPKTNQYLKDVGKGYPS